MRFELSLDDKQRELLARIPPAAWFDQVHFANVSSPRHPNGDEFEQINDYKPTLLADWMRRVVEGATVLDSFCANGRFSFLALEQGARRSTSQALIFRPREWRRRDSFRTHQDGRAVRRSGRATYTT